MKEFEKGQAVHLLNTPEAKKWLGGYAGTDAEIVRKVGVGTMYDVKSWNGDIFMVPASYMVDLDELYADWGDTMKTSAERENEKKKDEKNECEHPNAYINVISKNLRFKVCPDCKEDLGDA